MGLYADHILPVLIDLAMRHPMARAERADVVPQARGDVLEVGVGSGLNLPYYGGGVERLLAIEPSQKLRDKTLKRAQDMSFPVQMVGLDGAAIALDDNSVDTIVSTWVLCSIPDVTAALGEMRRVLKPSGKLIFVEHGLAPDARVQRWQNRLTPAWKVCAGGCHLNRRPDRLIEDAGFALESLEAKYSDAPGIVGFGYKGVARPR